MNFNPKPHVASLGRGQVFKEKGGQRRTLGGGGSEEKDIRYCIFVLDLDQ